MSGTLPYQDLDADAWLLALVDPRTVVTHLHIGHTTLGRDYLNRAEDSHLLWYVNQGAVEVEVARTRRRIFAGQAMWVNAGHWNNAWHRARSRIIYFRLRVERDGCNLRLNRDLLTTHAAWNLGADLEELIVEDQGQRPYKQQYIKVMLAKFFTSLIRQQQRDGDTDLEKRRLNYDQVNALTGYLRDHLDQAVTPDELARHIDRSLGYMTPLFKAALGIAPRQWIVQQKLQHAANLLRDTDDAVQDVAAAVGYADANLFSRLFRRQFGQTPSSHRRQARA